VARAKTGQKAVDSLCNDNMLATKVHARWSNRRDERGSGLQQQTLYKREEK
jgi:hypothetical protein